MCLICLYKNVGSSMSSKHRRNILNNSSFLLFFFHTTEFPIMMNGASPTNPLPPKRPPYYSSSPLQQPYGENINSLQTGASSFPSLEDKTDIDQKSSILARSQFLAGVYKNLDVLKIKYSSFWSQLDLQHDLELEGLSTLRQQRGAVNALTSRRLGQQGGLPGGVSFVYVKSQAGRLRKLRDGDDDNDEKQQQQQQQQQDDSLLTLAPRKEEENMELMISVKPEVASQILAENPEADSLYKKTVKVGKTDEQTFWTAYFLADYERRREDEDSKKGSQGARGVASGLGQTRTGSEYERNMEKISETLRTRVLLDHYKRLFVFRKDQASERRNVLKWARDSPTDIPPPRGEGSDLIRLINNHSISITGANSVRQPLLSDLFRERLSTKLVPLVSLINKAGEEASSVRKRPVCLESKEMGGNIKNNVHNQSNISLHGKEIPRIGTPVQLKRPQTLSTTNRTGLLDMYVAESGKNVNAMDEATGVAGDEALTCLIECVDRQQVLLLCTLIRTLYISPTKRLYKQAKRYLNEFERGLDAGTRGQGMKASKFDQRKALLKFYEVLEAALENIKPLVVVNSIHHSEEIEGRE